MCVKFTASFDSYHNSKDQVWLDNGETNSYNVILILLACNANFAGLVHHSDWNNNETLAYPLDLPKEK